MASERTAAARSFRDLLVWRRAHEFVLAVYTFTTSFPKHETYGLAQQMRVRLVIPGNIAEGFRRRGRADKARFMNLAEGSLEECRYYMILANDLKYGDTSRLMEISRGSQPLARCLRSRYSRFSVILTSLTTDFLDFLGDYNSRPHVLPSGASIRRGPRGIRGRRKRLRRSRSSTAIHDGDSQSAAARCIAAPDKCAGLSQDRGRKCATSVSHGCGDDCPEGKAFGNLVGDYA